MSTISDTSSAEADAGGRLARFVNGLLASLLGRKVVKKIGAAALGDA
ncbi:MAG: hypothetical protein HYZ18_07875 [Pseudogulbenkiania sp.]|nr:hypothetical protein [Pseudogulbenkiania sp.]